MTRSTVVHCDYLYIADGVVEGKCGHSADERNSDGWQLSPTQDLCPRHNPTRPRLLWRNS